MNHLRTNKHTDQERQQRLWCWYDFATNGYQITTVTALLPHYFSKSVMGERTVSFFGYTIDANSLWSYGLGIAALVVFLLAPILGAIADRTTSKRKFLIVFACGGIFFSSMLWFAQPGAFWFTWICFILAHICYTSGNVFYDSFLPHLTHDHVGLDKLSARGFAYGYLGSGIQFALVLGLLSFNSALGISTETAVRLSLLSAGLWWLIFSLPALLYLREPDLSSDYRKLSTLGNIQVSLKQNFRFLKILSRHAPILIFLFAFCLYNDGIQTVISISSLYATVELKLKDNTIMTTFLIVQFVAWFGALLFGRISQKIGTKRALMITLLVWMFVLWFGYRIPAGEASHFIILGLMVGLVLGGSQSLSRSLYASMMPVRFSAQCFGMFSVFNKLSSIMGPFLYGYVSMVTGSARPAILTLLVFFISGLILLWILNEAKARRTQSVLEEELNGQKVPF
jgi:UMF1 family MFS transporter